MHGKPHMVIGFDHYGYTLYVSLIKLHTRARYCTIFSVFDFYARLQPLQVWAYCIHTNASYSAAVFLCLRIVRSAAPEPVNDVWPQMQRSLLRLASLSPMPSMYVYWDQTSVPRSADETKSEIRCVSFDQKKIESCAHRPHMFRKCHRERTLTLETEQT